MSYVQFCGNRIKPKRSVTLPVLLCRRGSTVDTAPPPRRLLISGLHCSTQAKPAQPCRRGPHASIKTKGNFFLLEPKNWHDWKLVLVQVVGIPWRTAMSRAGLCGGVTLQSPPGPAFCEDNRQPVIRSVRARSDSGVINIGQPGSSSRLSWLCWTAQPGASGGLS